jgi:hypothetical protein
LRGTSFPGLFLGVMSRVFSQAHKQWVPMLGFDCRKLSNSNEKGKRNSNKKGKVALKARQTIAVNPTPLGVHVRVFIGEVKGLITMP